MKTWLIKTLSLVHVFYVFENFFVKDMNCEDGNKDAEDIENYVGESEKIFRRENIVFTSEAYLDLARFEQIHGRYVV